MITYSKIGINYIFANTVIRFALLKDSPLEGERFVVDIECPNVFR